MSVRNSRPWKERAQSLVGFRLAVYVRLVSVGGTEVMCDRAEFLVHFECVLYASLDYWLRKLDKLSNLVCWCALMLPCSKVTIENSSVG